MFYSDHIHLNIVGGTAKACTKLPNLKMDTINLKLQLVEGIEKQLVLGEELIAHHLQTRKSKPALISPSIVFKDAIASEKDPKKRSTF